MRTVLFLVICVVAAVSAQTAPNSTWWPCSQLTPYGNFELNQVLGLWYLVEMISALAGRVATCSGIRLDRPDNSSWNNLTMVGHESPGGSVVFYENHSVTIDDPIGNPGLWEQPDIGAAVMVTDVGDSTLSLTTCHRLLGFQWTGVFSRNKTMVPSLLQSVNERLGAAGLQNIDQAVVVNGTACPNAREV